MTVTAAAIHSRHHAAVTTGRRQPVPAPGQAWTGWRLWRVVGTELRSPYAPQDPQGRPVAWVDGTLIARCMLLGSAHGRSPAGRCECGIRAMPLPDLVGAMATTTGLRWASLVDQLGAVGQVELSGRIVPASVDDPRAALRASHARVLRVHLAPRLTRLADRIAEQLHVPVLAGLPALESPCPR